MLLLLAVSIGFESLFIHHGINAMDEGWPLHAAMEMHEGKTLFDEVFWVFPPGHVLPAWVAYAVAPPGLVGARIIYAAFSVALCLGLFLVARKLMPPDFALLAGLMVAVAAPQSHSEHLLFGYRYLAFTTVVLLLFHRRLVTENARWLFPAGIVAGVALFFRLTPAFAVSAALGVGLVAASRDPRRWIVDGLWYSAGLILVWIPVLLWFHSTVGLEKFWIEMVVRPVEMTALQSKPVPPLVWPVLERTRISFAFAMLEFRLYAVLYTVLIGIVLYRWGRAVWEKRPFENVFLLTFVVYGAIYYSRSLGRSDIPHLDSALPPALILMAYVLSRVTRYALFNPAHNERRAGLARGALCLFFFVLWTGVNGSDRFLDPGRMMGRTPLPVTNNETHVRARSHGRILDRLATSIQAHSEPDDTILVMTYSPLLYVLADRHSPGYHDFIMPGTFRSRDEEKRYLAHLKANPPAVLIWPVRPMDDMPSRGIAATAPLLFRWAERNYEAVERDPIYLLLVRKDRSS